MSQDPPGSPSEGPASRKEDGRVYRPGGTDAAGGEGGASREARDEPGEPSPPTRSEQSPDSGNRHHLLHLTLPGCWGALVLACLSFTPSLLPRGGILQGLICGISAAIGYGLGVVGAYVWRAFADRDARNASRRSWLVLLVSAIMLFGLSFGLGQYWQHEIRELMEVTDYNALTTVASPFVAALIFYLLLLCGRGIRSLYRWGGGGGGWRSGRGSRTARGGGRGGAR
ncbi:alpha/beta-hydrolase N-terminal domain-containing protein, partial [Streptomyces sp. NPDC127084]|uniref:alpha/beta-hydrolase N-terminal domain-containing protein n=1 Tax=Streptomyces sp. NPDC127084 TaxID=3347133 RepID=UPI00365BDF8A